ncbi:MAG: hypothetical protein A2528_02730 [Candidatus Staskawiczbacteria bacterium RIFOXYD2_FULL_37_9]|uniref:Excinuclease ABC subunit C n=1 Tax=Candidatus Staskawiczbacteria bacterium RIFOXYB1_FULL_37_44 TaxID=1802223 RepID=A0A1G2IW52_9BACT|nr:MAG: hypothetical protein A2358_03435 [Candidatus Staskawiczbacteria bacterium RIFOXYB1_FULL_37_44]OGZ83430.1 MAG: hypothetical protein A2416_00695 [Candidatus Staskawiczbacteria bacterium RIFOXYC1_FULL_37_52]OGZ88874.1 MAG: hypothetical protein A2581_00005 [Candidatus Staskawiczbacteria bacterium RIFOXYD1_FULL_37_110]OGZ94413.1 MAG: hypothetical protein A2528_02730 [Candidatus Staskawiczbacteria bacterium RIFOXYD2_FULL_37_9]
MERFRIITKTELEKLPKTAGVYCFTENYIRRTSVIYIGKAVNLQSRVKNHFNQPSYRDDLFIDKINKIGYFETNNSEIEALILEANLIKKYQPKYNVVWKDGKNYFYVAIVKNPSTSSGQVPYIFITHQPNSSLRGRSEATDEAIQSESTNYRLPRRPYRIFDLRAPRNDGIVYIGPFVEGAALKKTLRFLRKVFPYYTTKKHPKNKCTYCHLDLCPGPNPDLPVYKNNIKKLILILQGKKNAVLNSLKKEMRAASKENKFEEAGKVRDKIYALQQVMSHTHVINIASPVSNDRENLEKLLNLKRISRIECYDISNIQGKFATGSMVVFINGFPDKNKYRKFKIRLPEKPNDIAMLKEVLQRRFSHPEWPYPNTVLIDGGKAQLNIAISVIYNLGVIARSEATKQSMVRAQNSGLPRSSPKGRTSLAMTVMAIAKGRQELFIEGQKNPIPLKQLPQEIYNLIKNLDDEAHRFAIAYHKKLRKKNLLK